ncbi:hypothetical protein EB796_002040 [Bugula neritina]|uniref:Uncharacterized protein n=1 Tax=Bugula neritina TaxID=10212 RepID=A0A7J7KN99_BUGNE|nr:hypothetical protein EB796_002040 [Bugula neritina]
MLTSCLYSDCDSLLKSLTQLATDYNSNQMSGAKLQKLLTPMEAEYHGLVKAVDQHLSESVRSPELREQTRSIQRVWSSLQELVMSDCGPDDEAVKLYTELMNTRTLRILCRNLWICLFLSTCAFLRL